MTVMERPYRPGDRIRTEQTQAVYTLPAGLGAGVEVTVMRKGTGRTIVNDDAGREWTVPFQCLSNGYLYEVNETWLDEPDARAIAEKARLAALWAIRP